MKRFLRIIDDAAKKYGPKNDQKHSRPLILFFLVSGVLLTTLMLFGAANSCLTRIGMANWETTTGYIYEYRLTRDRHSYDVHISVNFIANNRSYRTTALSPDGNSIGWIRSLVTDLSEGSQTTVYYDPSDPTSAYVKRGSVFHILTQILIASGSCLLAIFMTCCLKYENAPREAAG